MSSQPNIPGILVFDVNDLQVDDPTVNKGDSMDLEVTFTGSGWVWTFIEGLPGTTVTAQFYAEGMGIGPGEFDLGSVDVPLVAGQGTYTVPISIDTSTAPTDMDEGVYRIQCLVQVMTSGMMGFFDGDLLVSVFE